MEKTTYYKISEVPTMIIDYILTPVVNRNTKPKEGSIAITFDLNDLDNQNEIHKKKTRKVSKSIKF